MGRLREPLNEHMVHLCLDMQRLFSGEGPWPTPWLDRVLPHVESIAAHATERTVFTRFVTPQDADQAGGTWRRYYQKWTVATQAHLAPALLELMPALARHVPPAMVFDKTVYSAFADGRLHAQLRARKVEGLIVTGSETDVCVLATVLAAVDHGYRVVVVSDAVCSSSDAAHDALLSLYRNRYDVQIEIAETAEVLESWPPPG